MRSLETGFDPTRPTSPCYNTATHAVQNKHNTPK